MGRISSTIVEFLLSKRDCTLHSNEAGLDCIYRISQQEKIEIANPKGKSFKAHDPKEGHIHFIEYHN